MKGKIKEEKTKKEKLLREICRTRFEMVKERHKGTFEKSVKEKKADERMVSLCAYVNSLQEYFTSSSCAGRILLLGLEGEETKKESYFHRKWHSTVKLKEVMEGLNEKSKGMLWFKLEPFILHIGTNNLENAKKILSVMKESGVKRGGIIVCKEGKFIIEFLGTETISTPIKKGEKILLPNEYIEFLVKEANRKFEKNYASLERLEKNLRGLK